MPLPGGPTDKLGNSYEMNWTARCMAGVLAGDADTIRLEPPGPEGQGIEFWLLRRGLKEFHQVKRQQAGKGRWSVADLSTVLQHFRSLLLSEPGSRCVFVSTEAAWPLAELAERAGRSGTIGEFVEHFLTSDDLRRAFAEVCARWDACSREDAWALLRRIEFRTVDERMLETLVASLLQPMVTGNASGAADVLARHALRSVHGALRAHDLWTHLESRGHRPTDWGKDASVAAALRRETDRYLAGEATMIARIARLEADQVVAVFAGAGPPQSLVFLTGEAGSGKSAVVAQAVERLQAQGWPVLAFRLDGVEAVTRPDQLAPSLRLPGSPAAVLAAVAHGRDSLLVVDQLDTVSTVSGRSPEFFRCFEELLRETQAHPRLRVLVACRSFDLEHDHRLRQLRSLHHTAPVIPVGRLPPDTVRIAVAALGLDPSCLGDKQVQLLSLPLHLVLLATTIKSAASKALDVEAALDLFHHFWTTKQQSIRTRSGRSVRWLEVIRRLCDLASRQQVLSVRRDALLEFEEDCDALVSEHVLRQDGARVSLFHESFFDYAYARLFVGREGHLQDLVLDGEQHLFRRAQVRQILQYRRAAGDRRGFLDELRWLLTADRVRFHLRHTGLLVLAGLPDPRPEEWRLVQELASSRHDEVGDWARRTVAGSPGWLRLLHDDGTLGKWLADGGPDQQLALGLLHRWATEEPDRCVALLEAWIETGIQAQAAAWRILGWNHQLIRRDRPWRLIRRLIALSDPPVGVMDRWVQHAPERCCEALALRTRRLLESPEEAPVRAQHERLPYKEAAEATPAAFLASLRDVVLDLIGAVPASWGRDGPPRPDGFGWHGAPGHHGIDALFDATRLALARLSSTDQPSFREHVRVLAETDWLTAHIIVARALATASAAAAPVAASYLHGVFGRYRIGEDEYLLWPVRDAIEAMSPHWGAEEVAAVAERVLRVDPSWERSVAGYKSRGRAQRMLLEALPADRLPLQARMRRDEWRRKEGTTAGDRPGSSRGGLVRSPLPEGAVRRMSDRQWLRAIRRYSDEREKAWLPDRVLGGARELATGLEARAKEMPERFAGLCLQFTEDTNLHYFDAVLTGVAAADARIGTDLLAALVRHCHDRPGRPSGHRIVRLVGQYAASELPPEVIGVVRWYGLHDPDPAEDLSRVDVGSGPKFYGGDPHLHGINTVRGAAADAVGSLLFARPERLDILRDACERLVRDATIAVRTCAAGICTALLVTSPDYAVDLFKQLVDHDDAVLAARPIEHFLGYALPDHFPALRSILDRMLASDDERIAQAGARQACLAAFSTHDAVQYAEDAVRGRPVLRRGAAEVYSHNLLSGPDRARCEAALARLLDDEDERVRSAAARFIYKADAKDRVPDMERLLYRVIGSRAIDQAGDRLFHVLEETTAHVVDLLLATVDRFLAVSDAPAADVRTRVAATAMGASKLLVRAYSQAHDEGLRGRCLDRIDALIAHDALGLEQAVDDLSR